MPTLRGGRLNCMHNQPAPAGSSRRHEVLALRGADLRHAPSVIVLNGDAHAASQHDAVDLCCIATIQLSAVAGAAQRWGHSTLWVRTANWP